MEGETLKKKKKKKKSNLLHPLRHQVPRVLCGERSEDAVFHFGCLDSASICEDGAYDQTLIV